MPPAHSAPSPRAGFSSRSPRGATSCAESRCACSLPTPPPRWPGPARRASPTCCDASPLDRLEPLAEMAHEPACVGPVAPSQHDDIAHIQLDQCAHRCNTHDREPRGSRPAASTRCRARRTIDGRACVGGHAASVRRRAASVSDAGGAGDISSSRRSGAVVLRPVDARAQAERRVCRGHTTQAPSETQGL